MIHYIQLGTPKDQVFEYAKQILNKTTIANHPINRSGIFKKEDLTDEYFTIRKNHEIDANTRSGEKLPIILQYNFLYAPLIQVALDKKSLWRYWIIDWTK